MSTKKKNSLFNLVSSLLIISAVAAAILAWVNSITSEPIKQAQMQKKESAMKEILPAFEDIVLIDKLAEGSDTAYLYVATSGNDTIGYAVETYTNSGYAGHFSFMIGFTPEGEIFDTKVLEHKETPGLGSKMTDSKFKDQFKGKNPGIFKVAVKKDMGDVDAITASTISSRAFCDGINRAYNIVKPYLKGVKQ